MGLEDKIKKLFEEREMRQRELAEKSGLSQATISRILHGKETNLRSETLESIAEALSVTAAYLMSEEQTPEVKDLFRGLEKLTPQEMRFTTDLLNLIAQFLTDERQRLSQLALAETQNSNHAKILSPEIAYELACRTIAEAIREGET